MPTPTIAFVSNTSWGIFRFRHQLIRSLVREGFHITVIAPEDQHTDLIKNIGGVAFLPLKKLKATSLSILDDFAFYREIKKIYSALRPSLVFHYTIKPNIYGTLAASALGIPVISVITGLGYAFMNRTPVKIAAGFLYRLALARSRETWFLNQDDKDYFVSRNLVPAGKTSILHGEGIDTDYYSTASRFTGDLSPPSNPGTPGPIFLLMARLIREKGIMEYVEAARRIRAVNPGAEFRILGRLNEKSPSAISSDQLHDWQQENIIWYMGSAEDVRPHIAEADCIVLPSWREGLPLSILEAGAMGKPVITTNTAGCWDVITDGINGFLCEPRNAESLGHAISRFLGMSLNERMAMGEAARKNVEDHFGMENIIRFYKNKIHRYIREC